MLFIPMHEMKTQMVPQFLFFSSDFFARQMILLLQITASSIYSGGLTLL